MNTNQFLGLSQKSHVLAVSPHPDDIALSCGGLMTHLTKCETTLVSCFTQSIYAPFAQGTDLTVKHIRELRVAEDKRYAQNIGAHYIDLGLPDVSIRYDDEAHWLSTNAHKDKVYLELELALKTLIDQDVYTHILAPLGIGYHIDHVLVRDAIQKIAKNTTYVILFYEDIPYAIREGGKDEVQKHIAQTFPNLSSYLVDISDSFQMKIENLSIYQSQIYQSDVINLGQYAHDMDAQLTYAERVWRTHDAPAAHDPKNKPRVLNDPLRQSFPIEVDKRTPYRVIDGKIHTEALELSIVENCNLSCRSCSHASPVLKKHHITPKQIEQDLTNLASVYRAQHVRLVGGEPLLHPNLLAVIAAVQRSNITDRIRLITNGTVLHRLSSEIISALDEIHVSRYPGQPFNIDVINELKQEALAYGTTFIVKQFDNFRETYAESGTQNTTLIRRIFDTCQIAHVWRCHTIADGYFFLCPQSVFITKLISNSNDSWIRSNGLKLSDRPIFAEELIQYLEREDPLPACQQCLGSVGKLFKNEQVNRKEWRKQQSGSSEQFVDWEFLSALEQDPDTHNGCFETIIE